tara:strand:- start:79 stop:807 length:729 start_codon:yes stop_codon:yes gene_type:complete
MSEIVNSLVENNKSKKFKFSEKKTKTRNILLIVCSADRGLCGGFNGSIIKFSKKLSERIINDGGKVSYMFVGKKAYQSLQRFCGESILDFFSDIANPSIKFELASSIRDKILELFLNDSMDECHLIYTEFKSAISQTVQSLKLLPLNALETNDKNSSNKAYDFEPSEEEILNEIIPKNIAIQIHTALLENLASEQGSRMTAMDNATRNANDMIDNLTLFYNRSRQALITKELIEIISGAEAV